MIRSLPPLPGSNCRPGSSDIAANALRLTSGSAISSSSDTVPPTSAEVRSISGAAPETVIDSSMPPTERTTSRSMRPPDAEREVRPLVGGEARQLRGDREGARQQLRREVAAVARAVTDLAERAGVLVGDEYGDSRQGAALGVGDPASKFRPALLREGRRCRRCRHANQHGDRQKRGSPQTGVGGLRRDRRVGEGCWQRGWPRN